MQFASILNAGYKLSYNYAANSQQISNIADSSYRYAAGESQAARIDAAGDRTVKTSGAGQSVSVNGVVSGGATGTTNFTAYISPYMVVNNGGFYSKYIYMGSQRIVSKLNSSEIFIDTVPTAKKKAYNMDFTSKFTDLTSKIKGRYDSLGVVYKGTSQGNGNLITSTAGIITSPQQYYFHSDHLGSTSIIADISGNVAQHIEYIPFGE